MSLSREKELGYMKGGLKYIMGIDEAGRGPLCGPVVAAACIIFDGASIDGIVDSKAVSKEEDRETTYERLVNNPNVYWGVSIVSHTQIDEINILQASLLAMRQSAQDLLSKTKKILGTDCLALIDGNKVPTDMPTAQSQFVIKGDSLIYSIAAASIIAKVTRDRIMHELDRKYPLYNLKQHKGYPTFDHRKVLYEIGPCEIYRFTFGPVKAAMERHGMIAPSAQASPKKAVSSEAPSSSKVKAKAKTASAPALPKKSSATAKVVKAKKSDVKIKCKGSVSGSSSSSLGLRRSSRLQS